MPALMQAFLDPSGNVLKVINIFENFGAVAKQKGSGLQNHYAWVQIPPAPL